MDLTSSLPYLLMLVGMLPLLVAILRRRGTRAPLPLWVICFALAGVLIPNFWVLAEGIRETDLLKIAGPVLVLIIVLLAVLILRLTRQGLPEDPRERASALAARSVRYRVLTRSLLVVGVVGITLVFAIVLVAPFTEVNLSR